MTFLASSSYFPNMVFYGPDDDEAYGVRGIDIRRGELGFRALIDAVKRERSAGRRWRGYLYTNDVRVQALTISRAELSDYSRIALLFPECNSQDLVMNVYALANLDLNNLWLAPSFLWGSQPASAAPMPPKSTAWWPLKEPGWSDAWNKMWDDTELDDTHRQRLLNRTTDGVPTVFFGEVGPAHALS
jgi:hypothetical protein